MTIILQSNRDTAAQTEFHAAHGVNMVFIRSEPRTRINVDRSEWQKEVLLHRS